MPDDDPPRYRHAARVMLYFRLALRRCSTEGLPAWDGLQCITSYMTSRTRQHRFP